MAIRKDANTLTPAERQIFVDAVKVLKADGRYNQYVLRHANAIMSAIHRCPAFLPWHRKFIFDLEVDLQQVSGDPNLGLPYWNWPSGDASASMWDANLLGGDGDSSDIVQTGPFSQGQWEIVNNSGTATGPLRRNFGGSGLSTLSTQADINSVLGITPYDRAPWNTLPTNSFRNQVEGWVGPNLHNRGHVWVGGSMLPMTSPNDPVFFMHHCMVDKVWHEWQLRNPSQAYLPNGGGAFGQNLTDPMDSTPGLMNRPIDVIDSTALDIRYDTLMPGTPSGGSPGGSTGTTLVVDATALFASIGAPGEVDVYTFDVPNTGEYVIETSGSSDTFMNLFGPNDPSREVTSDDDGGADLNARIASRLSPGTYVVRVRLFDPSRTGPYAIEVRAVAANPSLPQLTVDGPVVNGLIQSVNESDMYTFGIGSTGRFAVETLGNTDTFLDVFGPNSETTPVGSNDDSGAGLNARVVATMPPGEYFARVRHFSPSGTGPYGIRVTSA